MSLTFDRDMHSCDTKSLYTSTPTELGLEAIEYWILRKRNLIPQHFNNEFILESIESILNNNSFLFDSKIFNQIFQTAMGKKCVLPSACLNIAYQEETKLFTWKLQNIF